MSGGGGNSAPSQPSQQTTTINPIADWAQPTATALIGSQMQNAFNIDSNGNILSSRGFTPFGGATNAQGQFTGAPISQDQYNQQLAVAGLGVAGPSALQQQSYQGTQNLRVPGQYGAASAVTGYGIGNALQMGANATPQDFQNQVGGYMNPYMQQVLAPSLQLLNQQYGQQQAQEQGQATQSGAFGGGREAVMAGLNNQNQLLATNQLVGNAYNNAFNQAQNQYNQSGAFQLQANQAAMQNANQLAGIGGQQLQAQQGILGLQNQMGTQEQQNQQALLNQAIQNYSNQQQYGSTQAANIMNLLRSTPTTQTQTQYQAAPSALSQIGGLGATALGAYGASGGFKAKGGKIEEKKMATGGIASGVPAAKLPSMLANLSDQQLAQKTTPGNDPETIADAQSQQAFRTNARQGVANAAGNNFVNMADGGIVAFASGDVVKNTTAFSDADIAAGENPDQATLNKFYADKGVPAPVVKDRATGENDLATRSAEYKALLGDRSGVGAEYVKALKEAAPDTNQQLWGRLMQFGAGMAAGTSPNPLTNIGAAAKETVPGMLEDAKANRQAKLELAKAQYDIANNDYNDNVNLLKLAQTDRNKFEEIAAQKGMKADELYTQTQIALNNNKTQLQIANINASVAGAGAGATQRETEAQINTYYEALKARNPEANPAELRAQALSLWQQGKQVYNPTPGYNAESGRLKSQIEELQIDLLKASKKDQPAIQTKIDELRKRQEQAPPGPVNPFAPGAPAPTPAPKSPPLPTGIPQGSVQIGTSGGKPVYKAPDGKQYVVK